MEKSGKILENCNVELENTDVYYTVDYPCICLSSEESHSVFGIEEYIV